MYIFGPVPSRRLGLSLGVDLIAGTKTCNNDCIYCELGRTMRLVNERKVFVETDKVLAEIKEFFEKGGETDYITFSGSGEPTLALNLGEAIEGVRKISDKKIALITNSILLYDPQVRAEAAKADLAMPSLDAGSEAVFKKLNRPHKSVGFKASVEGLIKFSKEFKGELLLEVLIVKGFNESDSEVLKIKEIIDRMENIKAIQVNTVVRSRAEKFAEPVDNSKLIHVKKLLGEKAGVIGEYSGKTSTGVDDLKESVLEAVKRRPMTINDLSFAYKAPKSQITILVEKFVSAGYIEKDEFDGKVFYKGK